jgi:hypothetical protein
MPRTLAKSRADRLVPNFPSIMTPPVTECGHDNLSEELQINHNPRAPLSKCDGNDRMAVPGLRV